MRVVVVWLHDISSCWRGLISSPNSCFFRCLGDRFGVGVEDRIGVVCGVKSSWWEHVKGTHYIAAKELEPAWGRCIRARGIAEVEESSMELFHKEFCKCLRSSSAWERNLLYWCDEGSSDGGGKFLSQRG